MKLLQELLKEMAIKGGDLSSQAENFADRFAIYLQDAVHVGDIDGLSVKAKGNYFSLWDGSTMVACIRIDPVPNVYTIVDDAWVKKEYRSQHLFAKLLWFLKSRENHKKILLGKVHSDDTIKLLKAGGLSRFKKKWYDPFSGKEEVFDVETIDDFYRADKVKWSLMLEEMDDGLMNMPRFNDIEAGFVSQSYDWQIR